MECSGITGINDKTLFLYGARIEYNYGVVLAGKYRDSVR